MLEVNTFRARHTGSPDPEPVTASNYRGLREGFTREEWARYAGLVARHREHCGSCQRRLKVCPKWAQEAVEVIVIERRMPAGDESWRLHSIDYRKQHQYGG